MSRRRIAPILALALSCAACAPEYAGPPATATPRIVQPAPAARPAPRPRPAPAVVAAPAAAAIVLGAPPDAEVPAPAAAPPAPSPQTPAGPQRIPALLRDNPWLARFWAELDAGQRDRVTRALARRGGAGEPATAWDPLGLAERVALVFGAAS
jgi:hypothetical protein